ncbi:MAG: HAMP domain-containing sensor histidine kinase [Planctomycetota bacterium]|nr:HAMP domain-containing sensor histidine kinase [Planctomycetota bacterium]
MGRLSTGPARRGGALGRPLLLFAVLLLGPAAGFCVLGWNSVVREHGFRVREMHRAAQDLVAKRLRDAALELERIRLVEEKRHYYEFQDAYLSRDQVVETLGFQESALNRAPADPRIRGYFQWELFSKQTYGRLKVFPADRETLRTELDDAYGGALRRKLLRAPESIDLRTGRGRVERYSQRVVAANEERGQLREELELEKRNVSKDQLLYLENFRARAREAPVRVRYTPFRYLARTRAKSGPALIAWRMVWVAAEQVRWREVKRDRWLLQGYALDPSMLFPASWESIGSAQIVRGDRVESGTGGGVFTGSLVDELSADIAGVRSLPGGAPHVYDSSLVLAARADLSMAEATWRDARNRFLFLVMGLVFVVAVGFFVLVRSVRKEVLLARRKEDFIAAITHELKTPLTGIRMYADMLREGWVDSPEAADSYATRILDETDRLGHLVNQVLDLAALERGVAKLNATAGDLGEAVTSAVALIEPKAKEAGVDLTTEIADGVPPVVFDPQLVRPLVLNLVDNAIKYSARSDTKEVRVSLRKEGERAVLSVADRGEGIPAKLQKSIFEPFQRGGQELTRTATGIGIGLALVKRYADAHNARVSLSSEPGVGTTIEVRFRL